MERRISDFTGSIATQPLRDEHRKTYEILEEFQMNRISDESFIEYIEFLLEHHFPLEERILFPAFEPYLKDFLPYMEPIKMVMAEHNGVRNLYRKFREMGDRKFLIEISSLLMQHIYKEENGLFQQIDKILPEEKKNEVFFRLHHGMMEK
ncbi:MAG: hemerythrin domain-containing protein [Thermoplasmata archaeon]